MGEDFGEAAAGLPGLPGEDQPPPIFGTATAPSTTEVIKEKRLTYDEASKCLNTLGRDETGCRYAYLAITAIGRKLTDVSVILNFKHVLFVDLSGNYLTIDALQVLTGMPFLVYLKVEQNRIESASLKPMDYLQSLDFNQNQIKDVENIDQPFLYCLEMNFNDIYTTHFDTAHLDMLRQLEMRSNLLFEISGVYPPNIEKLYLAVNKITTINSPEFAKLSRLQVLHLRDNNLQTLDGFSENLVSLKYLNLRNNKINRFNEFKKLQCLPSLETLIVIGNPLPGSEATPPPPQSSKGGEGSPGEGGQTRDPVVIPILVLLPKLERINKTIITLELRIEAEDLENDVVEALLINEENGIPDSDRETTTTNLTSEYKDESDN